MVIDDGVGSNVRERVTALNCDSTQCNYTYYPAVGSRAEFGVSVEVAGCVTNSTVCLERPVCKLAVKIKEGSSLHRCGNGMRLSCTFVAKCAIPTILFHPFFIES